MLDHTFYADAVLEGSADANTGCLKANSSFEFDKTTPHSFEIGTPGKPPGLEEEATTMRECDIQPAISSLIKCNRIRWLPQVLSNGDLSREECWNNADEKHAPDRSDTLTDNGTYVDQESGGDEEELCHLEIGPEARTGNLCGDESFMLRRLLESRSATESKASQEMSYDITTTHDPEGSVSGSPPNADETGEWELDLYKTQASPPTHTHTKSKLCYSACQRKKLRQRRSMRTTARRMRSITGTTPLEMFMSWMLWLIFLMLRPPLSTMLWIMEWICYTTEDINPLAEGQPKARTSSWGETYVILKTYLRG